MKRTTTILGRVRVRGWLIMLPRTPWRCHQSAGMRAAGSRRLFQGLLSSKSLPIDNFFDLRTSDCRPLISDQVFLGIQGYSWNRGRGRLSAFSQVAKLSLYKNMSSKRKNCQFGAILVKGPPLGTPPLRRSRFVGRSARKAPCASFACGIPGKATVLGGMLGGCPAFENIPPGRAAPAFAGRGSYLSSFQEVSLPALVVPPRGAVLLQSLSGVRFCRCAQLHACLAHAVLSRAPSGV